VALRDTARALEALPATALENAAQEIVTVAEGLGSTIFGRRLSASYRIAAGAGTATATIHGTPTAPWVWINDGTSAHVIGTRRGRKGALLLKGAAHPIAPPVTHPGTSGRGAWRAVRRAAEELVPGHVTDAVHQAVSS